MRNFVKYLCIFYLIGTSVSAIGQMRDVTLVNSLNDSSYYLGSSSPKRALEIATKSLELAKKIDYKLGEIMAYCRKGNALVEMDKLDAALSNYNQAEKVFKKSTEDSIVLSKIYIYKSSIYRRKGMIERALFTNKTAFNIAEKRLNGVIMASSIINMSNIYKERGDYKKALYLLHKAVLILPKENTDELGALYNGIGNLYQDEGRFEEAIVAFKKAESFFVLAKNLNAVLKVNINVGNCFWDLDKGDSALFFYHKSLPGALKQSFDETVGIIYQNIGAIHTERGELDSASFYFQKSIEIKKEAQDVDGLLETLKSIGEIAFLRGNIDKALEMYQEAYTLALTLNYLEDLEHITRELSACYQKKNDWGNTLQYLELSKFYRDSISEKLNDALVYEINFEQEKRKVAELELKIKKRETQLERQTKSLWVIGGLAVIAVCLVVIFYILLKWNKQKRKAAEIEKQKIEKEKEIVELISAQEQAELSAMYDGQESERNRIAIELHDKLGGMLSTVKLYFKAIDQQINAFKEENIEQYQKANILLDEACDETRKIAHQLSSKSLGRIGLFATVKNMKNQISDSGQMKFELHTHGTDENLKTLNQISIYRIIQELVNNILKHAIATEINVQLNVFDGIFNLIIEDDGIGFDLNQMINNSGIGLREAEARIKNMNGTFSIDSGRGGGTTITIDIPLKK